MPGEERNTRCVVTMRQGNARIGGRGVARRDSWHHLKRNAGLRERHSFFAATAEDKRIAAFESHHGFSAAGTLHEEAIDLLLSHCVATGSLACINFVTVSACVTQKLFVC